MVDDKSREGELDTGETNGYFCSELIAATYKHLGLLESDRRGERYVPASRYYPLDFTSKGELRLGGGRLGEECDLVF